MSRSSAILLLIVVVVVGAVVLLSTLDTEVAPVRVEKDVLNEALAK